MAVVQPVIAVRSRGGSVGAPDPILAIMDGSGATPSTIGGGSTFGVKEFTSNADARANNKGIRFNGFLYAMVNGAIYRTPAATPGTPTLVCTFASALSNPDAHIGLYVRLIGGVPTLVTAYNVTGTATWKVVRSTDGTAWTESTITGLVNMGSVPVGRVGIFRNLFYFFIKQADNGHFTASIDAENVVGALQTGPNLDGHWTGDFQEYNGIFYCLSGQVNANGYILSLNGSTWTQGQQLPGTGTSFGEPRYGYDSDTCLFTDGLGNMIALYIITGANGTGMQCVRIVDTGGGVLTLTDITNATMPVLWRIASNAFVLAASKVTTAIYQELDSVAGVVSTHFWLANGNVPGTQWAYYPWNGIATPIGTGGNANDLGGDVVYTMPHTKFDSFLGGSQYIYDVSLPEVFFVATPTQGFLGEVHHFTVVAPGGVTKDYREWFSKQMPSDYRNGQRATFLSCRKVSGPGASPTLSLDNLTVQGCTGDGVTVYEAIWNADASGVAPLDRVTSFPEVV